MKMIRSYTARIDGNAVKIRNLHSILSSINELTNYIFSLGREKWFDQKSLYHQCRDNFPALHSKSIYRERLMVEPEGLEPSQRISPSCLAKAVHSQLCYGPTKVLQVWCVKDFLFICNHVLEYFSSFQTISCNPFQCCCIR